ncbi:MAG: hypothetical protein Fur0015_06130 [Ignavibacteriales bacterium]
MPTLQSKEFGELIVKLENLADGIDMHKAETNFVISNSDSVRELKSQFEDARFNYEIAANAAKIKYDEYSAKLQEVKTLLEKQSSLIAGFYGKKSQILGDFGISPRKTFQRKNNTSSEAEVGSN